MRIFDIPPAARTRLSGLAGHAGHGLEAFYAANHCRLREEVTAAIEQGGMLAPIDVFEAAVLRRPDASVPPAVFRDGLLARFALDLPRTVAGMNLPPCVLSLYPELTERLGHAIADESDDLPVDSYARNVAHVTGLFLPAVAQDLDLHGRLEPRMLLAAALKHRQVSLIARWLRHRVGQRFIEFHTDSRHLEHFNAAGRETAFLCAAEVLKRRPDLGGVFGVSWYYDPEVARISPRLAFLQTLPLSAGAFLIPNAPGEIHTTRATLTSPTRRRLYEEGKYLPTCYTMVWPRRPFLAWAERQQLPGACDRGACRTGQAPLRPAGNSPHQPTA